MSEHVLFRHFFDGLALAGALAEWALACWLLRLDPPLALHLAGPALLAVLNRAAARPFEDERAAGRTMRAACRVVLGIAFGALACAGALVLLAAGWTGAYLVGALTAEAGTRAGAAAAPLFGPAFHWLGAVTVGLVATTVGHGYLRGHRRLTVTSHIVPIPYLPPALAGLRIVHVSDLHVGPLADRAALRAALARATALDADLVCVTGDLVDSPAADLDSWIPELAGLRARLGVFAILGNHDRRAGAARVADAVRRATPWRVLRDEVATIERDGCRLHLIGLEDRRDGEPYDALATLLAGLPAGEPAILLAHRPDVLPDAVAVGLPLVLTGHTHGGQLAVPGLARVNVSRLLHGPLDAGAFVSDGVLLLVSRGLGTSGQRIRVGVPREIALLTLVPGRDLRCPATSAGRWRDRPGAR
jgi:predicted MPP superfamily phosphohydrolase